DAIKNKEQLPEGTSYAFKMPIDTSVPGDQMATVIVTYPDGSTDAVEVNIHVISDADIYAPEVQPITVNKGDSPDAAEVVTNKGDLPSGTTYEFKDPGADTSTPGSKQVVLVVTYPDGSVDEMIAMIYVTGDADIYDPITQPISIDLGETPDAADAIANKDELPEGTAYEFKDPGVDEAETGDQTATIIVTYPDGSTDEVKVKVHVNDQLSDGLTTRIFIEPDLDTVKKISWRVAPEADGYYLFRQAPGEDTATFYKVIIGTKYTDVVEVAGFYIYTVYPYKNVANGKRIIGQCENNAYTYRRLLSAENLKAQRAQGGILVSWDPVKYAEEYAIFRMAPGDEKMTLYKTIDSSKSMFLDRTNVEGYYFYRVIPRHTAMGKKYGAVSIHCATLAPKPILPLSPVQNFKAVNKHNLYNDLTWNKVPGAYGYLIYRQAPGEAKPTFYRGTTRNGFTEKVAVPGYYHYIVLAYRKNPDGTLTVSPQNGYATTHIKRVS
ncbi:MAG TPA: hypothetical protein GX717_09890, partial [Clostridiaceae bacterium]|nr:hypothetical protein [Clostridiaceae bacterium]